MAMRMSGLISGMDTESLIGQLVEARSSKVNKTKKAQTKLEWKQNAWKELNTKLKNLQSKFLSNMRFTNTYSKKVTKVSNPNAVSVITGENAVNGVQSLEISKLAKTGYLTGAELTAPGGGRANYDAMTSLGTLGVQDGSIFTVNTANGSTDIRVDSTTTISDVLTQMKDAGLNASFDARSQRFFVSAKESGLSNDFSITAANSKGADALSKLGLQTKLSETDNAALWNQYKSLVHDNGGGNYTAKTLEELRQEGRDLVGDRVNSYLEQYRSLQTSVDEAQAKITALQGTYGNDLSRLNTADFYENALNGEHGINAQIAEIEESLNSGELDADTARQKEDQLVRLKEQKAEYETGKADRETYEAQTRTISDLNTQIAEIETFVDITPGTPGDYSTYTATAKAKLTDEEEDRLAYAADALTNAGSFNSAMATKVNGQDAEIYLNNALFTSNTNTFEINGLTFTALSETRPGESITVTTEQDTDGIYDMVKNFIKEYNSIINEMDKLYNAESAKGYEPLTDDEKKAMSEAEAEKYEKKIKDALLRRDSNLSDISLGMRSVMAAGVDMGNGRQMHLFDFGIDMLAYFNAPDNEKNAYHIDGDPDDGDTAGNADKLKSLIASDPDTVISFFTKLSQNLYDKMTEMSKSVDGYRSFGNFYDDKKMKSDYTDYTSKIKDLEDKLNKYEDSWYKKFSKMETTMAKMQKNQSALAGLLGGS